MKLRFPVKAVPKGRPRISRNGGVYTPDETRAFENDIKLLAKTQWKIAPIEGAVRMDIWFILVRPKSSKKVHPSVKPDLTNYCKAIEDALNGICYLDDGQVCVQNTCKQYGEAYEIIVEVSSLEESE